MSQLYLCLYSTLKLCLIDPLSHVLCSVHHEFPITECDIFNQLVPFQTKPLQSASYKSSHWCKIQEIDPKLRVESILKNLLLTILLLTLAACGGNEITSEVVTPDLVTPTPAAEESILVSTPDFLGSAGVLGIWYCAVGGTVSGEYIAFWNNPTQLNFLEDQTVIIEDVDSISSWWYTVDGVAVQWSHIGNTIVYQESPNGGMQANETHCLRNLPPVEQSAPADTTRD